MNLGICVGAIVVAVSIVGFFWMILHPKVYSILSRVTAAAISIFVYWHYTEFSGHQTWHMLLDYGFWLFIIIINLSQATAYCSHRKVIPKIDLLDLNNFESKL
ncbi:MAG: hypothetical protein DRQ47_04530 [Gammaproteobacteria bacterium]|nr:MAG: hypothetical protein DRQ47_04530 [Gammaproteobacteria bacterium]